MTKGDKSIWRRIRHHTATVVAWGLVLLAVGIVGLLELQPAAWWEDSVSIDYVWGDLRADGVFYRVRLISDGRVLTVTWGRPVSLPFACVQELGLTFNAVNYHEAEFLRRGARSGAGISLFRFNRLHFVAHETPEEAANWEYIVTVPHWFVLLLLLLWPAKRGLGWLKLRRRRQKGLCLNCGYDLRASPQRCPECGMEKDAR